MKLRGFTLLETLVALSVLAIALAAAFRALGVAADSAGELRDRTLALLVADNRLNELRANKAFPALGGSDGEAVQAERRFRWHEDVVATPNPLFRRVDIRVFRAGPAEDGAAAGDPGAGVALARITGFLAQPLR